MDVKTLGWIEVVGGVLAVLYSGGTGYSMMRFGMMSATGGLSVTILGLLFIVLGIHHLSGKK